MIMHAHGMGYWTKACCLNLDWCNMVRNTILGWVPCNIDICRLSGLSEGTLYSTTLHINT